MALMSVSNNEAGDFRSQPRWSANRKIDVVLRLLRGEALEEVSREVGVEAHRLQAWRDDFLEAGRQGLKATRPGREGDRRLSEAERKLGELTMENEILRRAAEKRGLQIPPPRRPS